MLYLTASTELIVPLSQQLVFNIVDYTWIYRSGKTYYSCVFVIFMTGLSNSEVSVLSGQSLEQLEMTIVSLYPRIPLAMAGFILARAYKGQHIEYFADQTVDELEAFIGKGKLIVIPKRDLIIPEPVELLELNGILCRWAMTIQQYDVTVTYSPSEKQKIADAIKWHVYVVYVIVMQARLAYIDTYSSFALFNR